ncbi:hypothetical protein CERSUDRAFT_119067 [Gelatoporia subvermispora B]|uniref:BTB domain-containing protein n=1 Tax=Ceriporiopsis subvermispora (strain B) TaxID=914234 RepID=M2Q5J3_CERS8|nr:hypothetical protein CERSUDRAFT_119067 [Gelatoporia subvermispora B]
MQADGDNEDLDGGVPPFLDALHPLFSSPDGDVVLGSKDGVFFRVHSFVLKMASGWFRAMFTLPQKAPADPLEPIYVGEDASALEGLLRMICGLPIPKLDTYEVIEPILDAAEKYDMPGPLSIIRALVMTPALLGDPLRLYAMACRYGWHEEARTASQCTLSLNLHAPEHRPMLQKLRTDALLNLIELHHGRREALRDRLNDPPFVNDQGDATCSHCGQPVDYHTWRELKYSIIFEMDRRPLGDTIVSAGLLDWPTSRACWAAKCNNCDRVLYDKKETLRVIRECIDQLPATVDSFDTDMVLPSISSPP